MRRNDVKAKSGRKPLREVSNQTLKSSQLTKKKAANAGDRVDEDAVDRLLLVHSDITNLLHQIDELVAQAVTVKQGRKEVESFTTVLSEINSILQPWAPRFQKALYGSTPVSENQGRQPVPGEDANTVTKYADHDIESPDPSELDSMVSPSPLVSWRAADCTIEVGKQLFLLTPLPRTQKSMAKSQALSKTVTFGRIQPSIIVGTPSLCANTCDANISKFDPVLAKPNSEDSPNAVAKKLDTTFEFGAAASPKLTKADCSMILMTPCLKRSPPKSCMLLEPNDEFSNRDTGRFRKSTPFPNPVGGQRMSDSPDSESCNTESNGNLGLKYQQLLGLRNASTFGDRKIALQASPAWFMSPPKTCTLMEPPDEKSLDDASLLCHVQGLPGALYQQVHSAAPDRNDVQDNYQRNKKAGNAGNLGDSFALKKSTPVWKEPRSTVCTGKHPGENTLKRELWTKFEAASTTGLHSNFSTLQDTSHKGFLDRLEEASGEEI